MSRKVAREVAMALAFARLLGGENEYQTVIEQAQIQEELREQDIEFSNNLLKGIAENAEELDGLIAKYAVGWNIERMPRVDLCILRIALYEMLYCEEISHSISINEAVELAKRFGGDKSSAYINGVLGSISKGN